MHGFRVKLDTDFTDLHRLTQIIDYALPLLSVICHLSSLMKHAAIRKTKRTRAVRTFVENPIYNIEIYLLFA